MISFRPRQIYYNAHLAYGCYWAKCTFCSYREFQDWCKNKVIERPNIEEILDSLPELGENRFSRKCQMIVHTCVDCAKPELLNKILSAKKSITIRNCVRADKTILDVIEKYDDLSNHVIQIGMEGFCQHVPDELNKGFQISTALEIIAAGTERGARVHVGLMGGYPFLTKEDVKESFSTIDEIAVIARKKPNLINFNDNIQVWFPGEKLVSKYGFPLEKGAGKWYRPIMPKNSDVYRYNQEILDYIYKSNIPINCYTTDHQDGKYQPATRFTNQ